MSTTTDSYSAESKSIELEEDSIFYRAPPIPESLHPNRHRERDDYFFTTKFNSLSDEAFRQTFRSTRCGFNVILSLIGAHPVFQTNLVSKSQMHPAWQIAVALQRFGHYGSASSVDMVACDIGISVGCTVKCTNRVITALMSLAPDWIKWPDEQEREEHGVLMRQEGFPGCIGFVDGLTFPLHQKPANNGLLYFDHNKGTQVICDMHGKIIAVHTGCPGSAMFKRLEQLPAPKNHFSAGEYILANPTYEVSKFRVSAFRSPAAQLRENAEFNSYLACSHKRIENCIGLLRGRWQSLKELSNQVQDDSNVESLCSWIISCCVLHNIMAHIDDKWKTKEYTEEEPCDEPLVFVPNTRDLGAAFRDTLRKTTLETNRVKKRKSNQYS